MASIKTTLAFLDLAALADAIKRATTIKTTSDAASLGPSSTATKPLAPVPSAPERRSADTCSPDDPSPHAAAAADAPTASKAGWFVRAVSGLKAKWRAATAAAAVSKTAPSPEEAAPSPRTASAASTSDPSIATKAVAAVVDGNAHDPKSPKKTQWHARAVAAAEAKCSAACGPVATLWRATAAKASAALTPKNKASPKKGRRGKAGAMAASVPAGAALIAPAAIPDAASSPEVAAGSAAAFLVSAVASTAPEPAQMAPQPSSEASAAVAPSWRGNLGARFRAALPHAHSSRRTIKAHTAPTAKTCDASAAASAAASTLKGHIGAVCAAKLKLARLSLRRSPPDQAAASVAGLVGGEAAVAC